MPAFSGVCSFYEADGRVHVHFSHRITVLAWSQLERALQDLIDQLLQVRSRGVLLDLSSVPNAGSGVVTAIIRIWRRMTAGGRRVVVFAPSDETRATLALAGLNSRLSIVQTAGAAMDQLGLSLAARLQRRDTLLLRYISPSAAAGALVVLLAMRLTISRSDFAPTMLSVLTICATTAVWTGGLSAVREVGFQRHLSRLVSATGVLTLLIAAALWTV